MRTTTLPIPELGLIAATRGMLGAGIGLLLAGKLSPETRRAVGTTLMAVGIITTIPLVMQVIGGSKETAPGSQATPKVGETWEEREAIRTAASA
jgi:hypothetical protein